MLTAMSTTIPLHVAEVPFAPISHSVTSAISDVREILSSVGARAVYTEAKNEANSPIGLPSGSKTYRSSSSSPTTKTSRKGF